MKRRTVMPRLLLAFTIAIAWLVPAAADCVPDSICQPPALRHYPNLARSIGIIVDREFVETHGEAIHESFGPGCLSFSQCLTVWGNSEGFCRTLLNDDLRSVCEKTWRIDEDLRGWQQCRALADVFTIHQAVPARVAWPGLQKCAADTAADRGLAAPIVTMEPPDPTPGVSGDVVVKAFDPTTGFPVQGRVSIDGVLVGLTFQSIPHMFRLVEFKDAQQRRFLRRPTLIVEANPARDSNAPRFPTVTVVVPMTIPETVLSFDPPPASWTSGTTLVRVTARDSKTDEVLEGRISSAGRETGDMSEPVLIELRGGDEPCGDPVWFRPAEANRSDETFPISPCP